MTMLGFFLTLLLLIFYFLPAIIACERRAQKSGMIFLINLALGWTVLGWIAAVIWAATDRVTEPAAAPSRVIQQRDDGDGDLPRESGRLLGHK